MIEVDRQSPDFGQIDTEAARDLAAGHWLLAYPEGRISPDGTIGEFKDGAFIIAVTAQVPVVPVAIHGTGRIWPPGRRAIHAGQVRVVAGHPLPTSGLTHRDVAGLRDQARDVICSAHRDPGRGDGGARGERQAKAAQRGPMTRRQAPSRKPSARGNRAWIELTFQLMIFIAGR